MIHPIYTFLYRIYNNLLKKLEENELFPTAYDLPVNVGLCWLFEKYFFYFFFLQMNRRSNWNEMTGDEENEEKKNWKYFTYVSSLNLIKYSVFILEVWRGSLILYFFYDSCSGQRIIKILGVFPFIHKWIEKKNLNIECDIIIVVHLIFSFC